MYFLPLKKKNLNRLADSGVPLVQGDLQERHSGRTGSRSVEGSSDHHQWRSADRQQSGSGDGSRKIFLQGKERLWNN